MNTLVNFELAKLLKEKMFDKPVNNYTSERDGDYFSNEKQMISYKNYNQICNIYSRPTIAEVVMWLYEKYGIWIYSYSVAPYILDEEEYPKIVFVSKVQKFKEFDRFIDTDNGLAVNHFNSPIEAYEAAIAYTLKNLIKT